MKKLVEFRLSVLNPSGACMYFLFHPRALSKNNFLKAFFFFKHLEMRLSRRRSERFVELATCTGFGDTVNVPDMAAAHFEALN